MPARRKCESCGGWLAQNTPATQAVCRMCDRFGADAIQRLKARYCGNANYLGKSRRNFYISFTAWRCLIELGLADGLNNSAELELAIRERYFNRFKREPETQFAGTTLRKPTDRLRDL